MLLCNTLDDRAYTAAMLGFALAEERRKDILQKPKVASADVFAQFTIR